MPIVTSNTFDNLRERYEESTGENGLSNANRNKYSSTDDIPYQDPLTGDVQTDEYDGRGQDAVAESTIASDLSKITRNKFYDGDRGNQNIEPTPFGLSASPEYDPNLDRRDKKHTKFEGAGVADNGPIFVETIIDENSVLDDIEKNQFSPSGRGKFAPYLDQFTSLTGMFEDARAVNVVGRRGERSYNGAELGGQPIG